MHKRLKETFHALILCIIFVLIKNLIINQSLSFNLKNNWQMPQVNSILGEYLVVVNICYSQAVGIYLSY